MARIQILELPTVHRGDDMETPFALIIDEADSETIHSGQFDDLKTKAGARFVFVTRGTLDIVQP